MKTGALSGIYPGKYYQRMEQTKGLRGINRERLQADVANVQALGSQLFSTNVSATEQSSVLVLQQVETRLKEEAEAKSSQSTTLNLFA